MFTERICKKCGKVFCPAPQHIFVDEKGMYCSWTCFNHRKDEKPNTGRSVKKVELYSLGGCLLKAFTSATDAAKKTGYLANGIRDACREQKPYMGFIWKYRDEKGATDERS